MKRKEFIGLFIGLAGIADYLMSCSPRKRISGKIVGATSSIGHLLREKQHAKPDILVKKKVVIIGGGISGLSAARWLHRNNLQDFLLLDLEKATGGNAASGKNEISAYPWGAHYVPIPNNDLHEYLSFLQESEVITEMDTNGLPVYNEMYLCFDPQERLYINGRWQEGLIPNFGVTYQETVQINRFLQLMDEYRHQKGKDGRDAFAIPVDASSKDEVYKQLDSLTMKKWMEQQGFISQHLHQYVNYCTRDDFGTAHDKASAWTGIHYFASRKGKGINVNHGDILTWPEGNSFLVKKLQKGLESNIKNNSLAVQVRNHSKGVDVHYIDIETGKKINVEAEQCILATPQFVNNRLLDNQPRTTLVKQQLHYAPWMVANIKVAPLEERSGAPASWDNVIHDSQSLGYVDATHELLNQRKEIRNLTYYLPLTTQSPAEERRKAEKKSHAEWVEEIISDLKKIHPNLLEAIKEINIMIWGHAMAQTLPGLIHGNIRKQLSESIEGCIHFAHTDLAGVSIFEEGFYQGINAAKKVLEVNNL